MRQLSKDYGVSLGTVSNLLKRKCEIEEQFEENVSGDRCRKLRKTDHEGAEQFNVGVFSNMPL